jgi:signal transduction histidine kinase
MNAEVPIADMETPGSPIGVVEGTRFTKVDLLSLVADFAHDVRSPLTVISEFSSMMQEGVLSGEEERDEATGTICDKAAETLLLVDVLEMLVRAGCDSVEIRREAGEDARVLRAAVSQLEQFGSFRQNAGQALPAQPPIRVRCDASLAAMSLVHLWMWVRRAAERDSKISLTTRPLPELAGVAFLAAKDGSSFESSMFARRTSPLAIAGGRTDLTLRVACELGRLAGGDVFALENRKALALYVPSADDDRE